MQASRIGFVTGVNTRYEPIAAISDPSKDAYCTKWGYTRIKLEFNDPTMHPSWQKVPELLKLLESDRFDWLFWSDADAVLMNPKLRLEPLVDDSLRYGDFSVNPGFDFLVSADAIGINMGHFLIRNCAWSTELLRTLLRMYPFYKDAPYWEQSATMDLLDDSNSRMKGRTLALQFPNEDVRFFRHLKLIDKRRFNSYPDDYQPGDFMLHFPGTRGEWLTNALRDATEGRNSRGYFMQTEAALKAGKHPWRVNVSTS